MNFVWVENQEEIEEHFHLKENGKFITIKSFPCCLIPTGFGTFHCMYQPSDLSKEFETEWREGFEEGVRFALDNLASEE